MQTEKTDREPKFSSVLETPAATPDEARRHFAARLSVETDPSDVHADLTKGVRGFRLIDARSPEVYAECHVEGAINLPHRRINAESTGSLDRNDVMVVYCWGPGCNAAQKAAARLSALGFRVKEMIGGIEYWRREGLPVEGTNPVDAPLVG